MTAELTYVAVWPILDRTRPVGALIAEACRDLDVMAQLAGARIVAPPQWGVSVDDNQLVCHVLARAWNPDDDPDTDSHRGRISPEVRAHIKRLAMNGFSDRAIAAQLGVSKTTAGRHAAQVRTSGRA